MAARGASYHEVKGLEWKIRWRVEVSPRRPVPVCLYTRGKQNDKPVTADFGPMASGTRLSVTGLWMSWNAPNGQDHVQEAEDY